MKHYVGLCLALGDIYDGAGAGALISPLDGGAQRMLATAQYITSVIKTGDIAQMISCAGYSKDDPGNPQPERTVTLAEQADRFWKNDQKAFPGIRHTARPCCWSTINEIREGISIAQTLSAHMDTPDVSIVISSHPLHLQRIQMYTDKYLPKGWEITLVPFHHQFTLGNMVGEYIKMARDWLAFQAEGYRQNDPPPKKVRFAA